MEKLFTNPLQSNNYIKNVANNLIIPNAKNYSNKQFSHNSSIENNYFLPFKAIYSKPKKYSVDNAFGSSHNEVIFKAIPNVQNKRMSDIYIKNNNKSFENIKLN